MGTTTGVSKGIWQDYGTGWGSVKACLRAEPADANTESCEYLGGQDMGHAISKGPNAVGLGPVTVPEHHCIFPWRPGSNTERACKSPTQ